MKYTQSLGWINADLAIVAIVSIICLISYIMYMVIERNLTLTFNKKKNINHAESIKEN
jgi:hypothetical protein